MTQDEQDAFRMIEGGLGLLRKAVESGDPYEELLVRVSDLIREVQAIAWPDLTKGPDVHYRPPMQRRHGRYWR